MENSQSLKVISLKHMCFIISKVFNKVYRGTVNLLRYSSLIVEMLQ